MTIIRSPAVLDVLALGLGALVKNEREPDAVRTWLDDVYLFCDDPKQVNWNARRKIDRSHYEAFVVPAMREFVEENLRKLTPNGDAGNVIIGLSGGLDSVVTSYVVAQAMHDAVVSGRVEESNLALVNFPGLEDHDTKAIVKDLTERYDAIGVKHIESDILGLRRNAIKGVKRVVKELGVDFSNVPGELTTRMICSLVNEIGIRSGYISIDSTNGTEFVLGEFTVGLGYDMVLLSDLYKSSVFEVGEILNVPRFVLEAQPRNTAYGTRSKVDLYFGRVPEGISPRQAYEVLDPVLHWLYEEKRSPEEIAFVFDHDIEFVRRVKRRIDNQENRRIPPRFCVEDHEIRFEGSLACGNKESIRLLGESMLEGLFLK